MTAASFWKKYFWNQLGFADLNAEEFNKRVALVQLGAFTASCGTLYCLLYVWLGFSQYAYTAWIYIVIYFINLFVFILTKNYNIYRITQPFLILLAPLAAHVAIGGFTDSSVVILACFLSPVIALAFANRKMALVYQGLFIVAVVLGGLWDLRYGAYMPKVPKTIHVIFFINNITVTCSIIYYIIDGFLRKNKELQDELRHSLEHLKATQNQLIQREKMASLGELTAGVAHEIQNPLNFVNNFSEVSIELLEEMEEGRQRDYDPDLEAELMTDLKNNLRKIIQHGQRASSIVKGMLEHSRTSSGEVQPTDLNALADEYLRLAYHGLRAKDKDFNCDLVTHFDPTLGPVAVMPQEMGRVLLNLFTNAFYAVRQRQKQHDSAYHPAVRVSTTKARAGIEIRVSDNGTGISAAVQQKIFQPFFTTKPTGEGTGLGLSLSYDIVTKGHGGTLLVESQEGQGTEFIVQLPAAKKGIVV